MAVPIRVLPIRVLIVDDSALARAMLRDMFESDGAFEVVAEAENGLVAVELVRTLRPGLVTRDLEMPQMGGIEAIEEIMGRQPVPILVVSGFADARNAFAAVSHGAVDVIAKPDMSDDQVERFLDKARLVASIRVITHMRGLRPSLSMPGPVAAAHQGSAAVTAPVFAIASSTGGPQALARILGELPPGFSSPVLIAQHVAPGFAGGMAEWLGTVSRLPVVLASDGDMIVPGKVYLSPSEAHMTVGRDGRIGLTPVRDTDIYRPSCDTLLESVAAAFGARGIGIILTGMGKDGARGLGAIRAAKGTTLAQDETSSVVFGMNKVAIDSGHAGSVLAVENMAAAMIRLAGGGRV